MFFKISVLRNFAIFTRKHLCWRIKLQTSRPVNFLKRTQAQVRSCKYCEIFKNTYFEKHLRTTCFDIWKCFLIHKIGIIILNLLWKTYFMCILLSNCTNTVAIRLTNKRTQIAGSTNNLVWRFKKTRASVREKKTGSRSWPCELDQGRSLWEINCSF